MTPDKKLYHECYLFNHYPFSSQMRGLRCYSYFDSIYKPGFQSQSYSCDYGVISIVISGEYKQRRIGAKDFNTHKAGTFSISIPYGVFSQTKVTSKEQCVRKGLLIYPTEEYKMLFRQYFSTSNSGIKIMLNDMEPVVQLFDQIREEFKKKSGALNDTHIAGLIMEMLELVLAQQQEKQETYPPDFEKVLMYIKNNFSDSTLDREQIAREAGISVRSLNRMFQRYMRLGITQYIMDCRLRRAADMLLLTSLRINEIADQCGFGSAIYLSRIFREHYKMTPKEFRMSRYHVG